MNVQANGGPPDANNRTSLFAAAKERLLNHHSETSNEPTEKQPYESGNRHLAKDSRGEDYHGTSSHTSIYEQSPQETSGSGNAAGGRDTSETIATSNDPRQKRKIMKMDRDHHDREVTDPITHLPVTVHDATDTELKSAPENEGPTDHATGGKHENHQQCDTGGQQATRRGMESLFPPPSIEASGKQFASILTTALTVGLGSLLGILSLLLLSSYLYHVQFNSDQTQDWSYPLVPSAVFLLTQAMLGTVVILGVHFWAEKKILAVWEDGVWDAARTREQQSSERSLPESVQWLNSVLAAIWPLINPDLFTSLADTLEDVMQASLPRLVRMISVEDLGQGNEALRVLGIKWLPTGNAKKDVSVSGQIQDSTRTKESDRKVPNKGEMNAETKSCNAGQGTRDHADQAIYTDEDGSGQDQGLEAEEGDFVNVEVGFSYRASKTGKSMKVKAKNAHLYLVFYLPGNIRFPVWVELRGMVGTMRLRLQLSPDPPFVALCTLTFLGQPKVDLSCVPLTRKGLNIMDLPLISSFVQSSIDAALAEYVTPKGLTLDLKDLLVGDDFKKDTSAHGVLVVTIDKATEFKEGDRSLGGMKKGSNDMKPSWNETAYILVSPEELNASERLRVQLWDSDRTSADDDLGRIEVDLEELMSDPRSHGRMWQRQDGFHALIPSEDMPGTLIWSVGYFPKERIQQEQLERQSLEPDVKSLQHLKDKVARDVGRKMREASSQNESPEINQQEAQDLKTREDNMVASTTPSQDSPMGILSLQIHQISGLELERINKPQIEDEMESDTAEGSDDLPSSYCTVILNHQKIFRTRTKPKSSNPFFNAGTERFVRNWRSAEIIISVRDARVHENHPLISRDIQSLG
ncbi:MAG: hypothetical protein Q9166_004738 [cf. Caloplaca sp. 2 TL-2023]